MVAISGIEGTDGLSYDDFIVGCREHAHWFQPWIGRFRNGSLQNEMNWFLDDPVTGEDNYFELPRGHTKTVSVAHRLAHEIGKWPDIRIKYITVNDEEAQKTVKLVGDICKSEDYAEIFPGVVDPGAKLGMERFTVNRPGRMRDPTIEGIGVLGNAGSRCDLLVFDDICNLKNAVMQPSMREHIKQFVLTNWMPTRDWSNEQNGRRPPRTWRFGTPYHVSDITADWRKSHGEKGTLFRRPVKNFVSPWPEGMTSAILRKLYVELGPIAYGRAYELLPVSSDQLIFPLEWLEQGYFTEIPQHVRSTGRRIAAIDLSYTEKSEKKERPDWSVFLTGIKSLQGELWIDRMWRVRSSFPDFVKIVKRNVQALGVKEIIAEISGAQRVLVDQIRGAVGCAVRDEERDSDKVSRAAARQDFVMAGKLHIRCANVNGVEKMATPELQPLVDEMATFPAGDNDDTVDACCDLIKLCEASGSAIQQGPVIVRSPLSKFWRIYGR